MPGTKRPETVPIATDGGRRLTGAKLAEARTHIFNDRLDALVCGAFLVLVAIVVFDSLRVWYGLLRGTRPVVSSESPFVLSRLEAGSV